MFRYSGQSLRRIFPKHLFQDMFMTKQTGERLMVIPEVILLKDKFYAGTETQLRVLQYRSPPCC